MLGALVETTDALLRLDGRYRWMSRLFGRLTAGRDEIRSTQESRISTGLARPDVLDWHGHVGQDG